MNDAARRNVLLEMRRICEKYISEFLPAQRDKIVEPPPRLRCGVARGSVLSIGDGQDYVGSCINMAARLEKLPGISFCFNRRGFELDVPSHAFFTKEIVAKEVSIRGIGEHELVSVLRKEVETLNPKDRRFFKDVTNARQGPLESQIPLRVKRRKES